MGHPISVLTRLARLLETSLYNMTISMIRLPLGRWDPAYWFIPSGVGQQ